MPKGRQELPRISDRISFIYVEHSVIEQDGQALVLISKEGRVPVPISQFTCLMLGPGTSVTHAAFKCLADNECMVFWCGENGSIVYSIGRPKASLSQNLLKQASICMDEDAHMSVVHKMYGYRFGDMVLPSMSLSQLRGIEGTRMRRIYHEMSEKYNVPWNGRSYKPGNLSSSDVVNQFITLGNSYLYAICEACICALGYSPALGFIHTGRMLSFVYDIADLYKAEITIPVAFEGAASNITSPSEFRKLMRKYFTEKRLLQRIPKDITNILDVDYDVSSIPKANGLWSHGGYVIDSGKNFGDFI